MILKMSKARGRMFAKLSDEVRVGDYAEAAQTAAVYVDILLEENAPASRYRALADAPGDLPQDRDGDGGGVMMSTERAMRAARHLARGRYQRALLDGSETLSGSSLEGKAKSYAARYRASRDNLEMRIRESGIPIYTIGGTAHTGPRRWVLGDVSWIACSDPEHPDCLECLEMAQACARETRARGGEVRGACTVFGLMAFLGRRRRRAA